MNEKEIIKEQDEQLEEIEVNIKHIKNNARLICKEIDDQKHYIEEMNIGMNQTQKKMETAIKKIADFLQIENKGQMKLFCTLLFIAIIMFFMLIIF